MSDTPTNLTFEVQEFEGENSPAKGFKFQAPVFTADQAGLDAAVAHYGLEDTMKVLGSAIISRIRTKVKNDLGFNGLKPAEITNRKQTLATNYPDFIVFDEAKAAAWKPDVREITPNQIMKQIKELNGDTTLDAPTKAARLGELVQQLAKVTAEFYS